ncbi:unnamed protein product [Thelazia callipaeda]|uniref:ULP_PROTEASE domain-containing protein n=1 Tax=Thelazia callipaeda TaxID=103827 RepID=A0A0N5CUX1_THECL|nr:unnamed protein product [Thelazia callipaeda]
MTAARNCEENTEIFVDEHSEISESFPGSFMYCGLDNACGEHENEKSDFNEVEDALEKTINEVAQTSLQSAAVEGEDLVNACSNSIFLCFHLSKVSKYDWDAPIVKDIVRRVKKHRLSHAKAAEQLSVLMDVKVTSIGVRLQVIKMANDDALAKQDQKSVNMKTVRSGTFSSKAYGSSTDILATGFENKSPICYRTRSKTKMDQNISLLDSKLRNGAEVLDTFGNNNEMAGRYMMKNERGNTSLIAIKQSNEAESQPCAPVAVAQQTSITVAPKKTPPVIRLLDNEGRLTHIAVAENGSYKLYRVNEASTNTDQMQMLNHDISSSSDGQVCTNDSLPSDFHGTVIPEKNLAPSCRANFYIESVPAEQTLGALVGIPKFVNSQRCGGSSLYTGTSEPVCCTFLCFKFSHYWNNLKFRRTYDAISYTDIIRQSVCRARLNWFMVVAGLKYFRTRNEIKNEVKGLIRCVKSQHITCQEALKQLLDYALPNVANNTLLFEKQINEVDENRQDTNNSVDYKPSSQEECGGENVDELYTRLVDEHGNMNIAIAEGDGYRVYRLIKASNNLETFRCLDCEMLRKTKDDAVATVEIIDGMPGGEIHPLHNEKCPLQTLSVKECEQNLFNDERDLALLQNTATDIEETRKRKCSDVNYESKQKSRRNRLSNISPVTKQPYVIPERRIGMTLRKRKVRAVNSPGIYGSEVMS